MSCEKRSFVYMIASRSRTLYTGVTNNIERRIFEHKQKAVSGFTKKYRIDRLVHFERFGDIRDAFAREKQIKSWRRQKKVALIEAVNPTWEDLAADWYRNVITNHKQQIPRPDLTVRDGARNDGRQG